MHDLVGKILNKPLYKIWGFNKENTPDTTFTIGIDTEEIIKRKVKEADDYKILKIKLGSDDDKKLIRTIREVSNKPIAVDVNQGWKDKEYGLDLIHWLKEQNVVMVEQPMPKELFENMPGYPKKVLSQFLQMKVFKD